MKPVRIFLSILPSHVEGLYMLSVAFFSDIYLSNNKDYELSHKIALGSQILSLILFYATNIVQYI